MRGKWILLISGIAALALLGGLAYAGHRGSGPFAPGRDVTVTQVIPDSYSTDEMLTTTQIGILFYWPGDGMCPDQFSVSAVETADEVRVSDVTSREYHDGNGCAGVGLADHRAAAVLQLTAPVGSRRVVRQSDGVVLPYIPPPPPGG